MILETSFRIEDGDHGSKRLVQYGRCDGSADTVAYVEDGCSIGKLVRIPASSGTVFKVLDGTNPEAVEITPPTMGRTYSCVKVAARVWPLAPVQVGGVFEGYSVLRYEIIWQQVGDIA
jgi:hypothetical protein